MVSSFEHDLKMPPHIRAGDVFHRAAVRGRYERWILVIVVTFPNPAGESDLF